MIAVAAFAAAGVASRADTVRVGLYQNEPKVFTDEHGRASGIFIDLIDKIAEQENWKLVYVPCEWAECLHALEQGQIDLMPDVAYSPERDKKYDFHKIPVAESWSQIYSNPRVPISRLADLNGRRVALLKGSIQQKVLKQTMSGFGFHVTIVPVGSFEEAFKLVHKGYADAAITNHFFGDYFYQKYGLVKSTIVFNVVSLYYATAHNRNSELLSAIDRHLSTWIKQPNSAYYKTLGRWTEKPPVRVVPRYIFWIIGIIGGLLSLAAVMILLLRRQVRARTEHLVRLNEDLRQHREHLEELVEKRTGELLKTQEQLIQSQKMEAVGQLAGGISHDFNNMLAVILGTAELILKNHKTDDKYRARVERIMRTGKRAKDLTGRLLTFARKEQLEISNASMRDILLDTVEMLKSSITKKIQIHTTVPEDELMIRGDVNQLEQALLNICINACDAIKEGGVLKINAQTVVLDNDFCGARAGVKPGGYRLVQIIDDGCGIPEQIRGRIFDPFFTTKEKGEGTGLGLSVTQGIVEMHDGLIEIESKTGQGTTVNVYIPAAENPAADDSSEPAGASQKGNRETILVVDDERDFTDMVVESLSAQGYNPVAANSGEEALDTYQRMSDEVKLVLLDIMMPGMDGGEVFNGMRRIRPDVKVVLCSGFSVEGMAGEIIKQGACAFVQKPYDSRNFLKTIYDVLHN